MPQEWRGFGSEREADGYFLLSAPVYQPGRAARTRIPAARQALAGGDGKAGWGREEGERGRAASNPGASATASQQDSDREQPPSAARDGGRPVPLARRPPPPPSPRRSAPRGRRRADWLGPEVRLWGDAGRPAQRRDTDKGCPKAVRRLPGLPPRPRAGATRDGRGGAAALGALLGGGNASPAGRPQTPRPPRPAARSNWRWGTRRAEGRSRCHARRAPGSQWAGRENAGSTRGPRVPRHGLSITRQSVTRPAPPAAPPPGAVRAGPQRRSVTVPLTAARARAGTGAGERSAAAAALSQAWGARESPPHWNGSPAASAPQFLPPAPSPRGPAPSGCPRCGLRSRRPPPVGGERRSRRGRRPPPLSGVAARGVALGNTLL
ncbi:collagen alpha-1(I) chain-like [Pyrgilauda ruficollis]|uniref:collagen alpha-1(I) chain-like n=1 Tax=Pyrgilauda ruficollis TaxID=221976 RepID=UPI001B87CC97|nr:collagen alpha-1(I) chain-like [Pyrgilauda ruficollis]